MMLDRQASSDRCANGPGLVHQVVEMLAGAVGGRQDDGVSSGGGDRTRHHPAVIVKTHKVLRM